MKKLFLFIAGIFPLVGLFAQNAKDDGKVVMVQCTGFEITRPLSELARLYPAAPDMDMKDKKESEDRMRRGVPYMYANAEAIPQVEDPVKQTIAGTKKMLSPLVIWTGLSGSGYPPDPTGAAGPNNFVQGVNTEYKVYTKTGGSVTGTIQLGTLLFGVNNDGGDPIVLYDKFADRWFISEFINSNTQNITYIAVSTTSNPAGSYAKWQFTSPNFPDYEKFSIWQDGYYMTSNQGAQVMYVFNRDQMLAGNASPKAFYKSFNPPSPGTSAFFCPLPADADGQLPPANTPCPIFSYEDNGWGSGHADRINIFTMTVNWAPTTPTATITGPIQLASAAFDASYNSNWDDIPQPGTTQKLDGIGGVLNFRAQYRVWSGYNTVVINMGVKVSSTQRSIRWYELRQDQSTGTWSIYQQSTYAPADGLYRWCGSIAMDDNGSIGLAYSVSGSSGTYPSIRYTGRNASDPLNQMTYAEQTAQAGTASQTGGINRWGDYTHTSLDPVNGTLLWHTGEYITTGGQIATKIFSFRIPVPTGIDQVQSQATTKIYKSNDEIIVKAANLPSNSEMMVDLFDINGRLINGKRITPAANLLETSFNVNGFSAGTYLVRIGQPNTSFQKVTKIVVE